MSASVQVRAYSSTENKEFQKHFNAVIFCIENELSFPKETSEFFQGKVDNSNLEDFKRDCIIDYIKNGVEIPLNRTNDSYRGEIRIKVSDIPKEVDLLIVKLSI